MRASFLPDPTYGYRQGLFQNLRRDKLRQCLFACCVRYSNCYTLWRLTKEARMQNLTARTQSGISAVLSGDARGWRSRLLFAGPAIIASVAYMDPGNYATNIQAGAGYGYRLLWVVLLANLIAMLFQALSARLGIVTGKNLAEVSRDHLPRSLVWAMWAISEVAAMATDLAEFLGGAIGLALLFGLPLVVGMAITAVVTYGILIFEGRGFRPMELIIGAMVGVIGLCYLAEVLIAPVDWTAAGIGMMTPALPDSAALTIAVGIIGATVMPHAIYLHSGLMQNRAVVRDDTDRRTLAALFKYRGRSGASGGRNGQHRHGHDGSQRLSPGPCRCRRDRDRLPYPDAAAGRGCSRNLSDVPDCIRCLELRCRNHGRADDHARVLAFPRADLAAPSCHHGAGLRGHSRRGERNRRTGDVSGGAIHRATGAYAGPAVLSRPGAT
jgi:hypothetical protein